MIINGIESETYEAKLMDATIGFHNVSDFYDIINHDEYLLRGRPSFAPCNLAFMVRGDDEFILQANASKLRKELEKTIFEIIDANGKKLKCYGVYNNFAMEEKFIDFMTGKWVQKITFNIEVFRKEGETKTASPNNGTTPSRAIITANVTANTTSIAANIDGKRLFTLSGTFESGDIVVINLKDMTVKRNDILEMDLLTLDTDISKIRIPVGSYALTKTNTNFDLLHSYEEVYL